MNPLSRAFFNPRLDADFTIRLQHPKPVVGSPRLAMLAKVQLRQKAILDRGIFVGDLGLKKGLGCSYLVAGLVNKSQSRALRAREPSSPPIRGWHPRTESKGPRKRKSLA